MSPETGLVPPVRGFGSAFRSSLVVVAFALCLAAAFLASVAQAVTFTANVTIAILVAFQASYFLNVNLTWRRRERDEEQRVAG